MQRVLYTDELFRTTSLVPQYSVTNEDDGTETLIDGPAWSKTLSMNDILIVYIIPTRRFGVYEVRVRDARQRRVDVAMPLVDGALLTHRALGNALREAALNHGTRQRLQQSR